jgi:hypothetical protein
MNQTTGAVLVNGQSRKVNDLMITRLIDRIKVTPGLYDIRPTRGQAIQVISAKADTRLFIYQGSEHWRWAADVCDGYATFVTYKNCETCGTRFQSDGTWWPYCDNCAETTDLGAPFANTPVTTSVIAQPEMEVAYCSQCLMQIPENSAQYDVCDTCTDEYLNTPRQRRTGRVKPGITEDVYFGDEDDDQD